MVNAATYYVRADGNVLAANKANATGSDSANTALNMAQVKAATFIAGDHILFSSQGGNYTEKLVIPSSGSGIDNEITYGNVPDENPVITVASGNLIDTNSKSNVVVQGFVGQYTGTEDTNIGILIRTGSNITLKNLAIDMGGYGYNVWSNSILSNIVLDTLNLTNSGSSRSAISIIGSNASNIIIKNSTINTGTLINVLNTSSIAVSDIFLRGGISFTAINSGTINNVTASSSASVVGLLLTNSSGIIVNDYSYYGIGNAYKINGTTNNVTINRFFANGSSGAIITDTANNITINDSSVVNGTVYGAFQTDLQSHDITYNRCTATYSVHGFVSKGTSNNVTCNNCRADYNSNIGFLASISSHDIIYWHSEASYNGTVNDVFDGGGVLPHDSAASVKCYYCIFHHNYNQGLGDVGDGTNNEYYNTVNWINGYNVGDVYKGSVVSTPSARSDVYYRKSGGSFTLKNGIFGNGKPREILNTGSAFTALDYNLYKALDDNKFYNTANTSNNLSWANYHATNETHSQSADPLFLNATGSFSTSTDFQLSPLSPAIDSGTDVDLTTDYLGNPIYGTPDIGAYEYQPPFTQGTHRVDPTAPIRIYGDGKYRYMSATSSSMTADFSVAPQAGFSAYDAVTTRPEYMNVALNTWQTTGDRNKQWTASSTMATTTVYTIGDLLPNTYYTFKLDGTATSTVISSSACTGYACLSDSTGKITFTYTGHYSTHTFDLTKDTTGPSGHAPLSPTEGATVNDARPSFTWSGATDSESGFSHYQFVLDESMIQDNLTSPSYSLINPISCGSHTWHVNAFDNQGNTATSATFAFTFPCGGSPLAPGAYLPPTAPQGGFKLTINNGASTTNSSNVTLSLQAGSDAANMVISESPTFAAASIEPFASTRSWTLTTGTGPKTVYVKFYTKYGVASDPASATITLNPFTATSITPSTPTQPSTTGPRLVKYANDPKVYLIENNLKRWIVDEKAFTGNGYKWNQIATIPDTETYTNGSQITTTARPAFSFTQFLTVGSIGEDVRQLQTILKRLGFFSYPSITNYFGQVTKTALIKFQQKYGLTPSAGYTGPGTRAKLNALQ